MFKQDICYEIWGGDKGKYRLRDSKGNPIDQTPEDTCARVAKALSDVEPCDKDKWYKAFLSILGTKFAGGGRIMANAGAGGYKKETSLINCVVLRQIADSMIGIMTVATEAALTLKAGCGVGYDFSTIRPKGAYVFGAGAETSGVMSFIDIFNAVCKTVMSGGGRRGAQMGCLDIQHPDIEEFILSKRQDGAFSFFNFSVLITDAFMQAVQDDADWDLWFWEKTDKTWQDIGYVQIIAKNDIPYNHPDSEYFSFAEDHVDCVYSGRSPSLVFKRVIFKTIKAKELFELITKSTYNYNDPGFILIDKMNSENNLGFMEFIRATNPCGEQPLPPMSNCLLGSMILCAYVRNPFTPEAWFDWLAFAKDVRIAARLLDNVIDINNLPLPELEENLIYQRRHGMGFTGLGSALNLLGIKYNSDVGRNFAEKISRTMAQQNLLESIEIAKQKGPAPFATKDNLSYFIKSEYNQRLLDTFENKQYIIDQIMENGVRWSHATSLAPTGTLSLTWGNNCSNGLEPVFTNSYLRNVRLSGKKTKTQMEVYDYAYYEWRQLFGNDPLPKYWVTADDLKIEDHLNMQAVIQKYIDSATSKTINVPTDCSYEEFKNVYFDGWKKGLKGVTTYRFNPKVTAGVLVRKEDMANTSYTFILEDGKEVVVRGDEEVEYDGEVHNAANLFEALKEGIYGKM